MSIDFAVAPLVLYAGSTIGYVVADIIVMNYDQALEYMQGLRRFGIKLGNERFEALLSRLGDPHRGYSIAHVAGTKGKGSTTALIAAILHEHGFRVGSYFSPYVFDVRERVQVDGEMIPRDDFARLVSSIRPHTEAIAQEGYGQVTEFELKTAVGFLHFAERNVDFASIEVGIGGRLDATNVVSPRACVITNIGLDHTHILGNTHAKIAAEKAGIIKPGIPCVTAVDMPSAASVITRIADERRAPLIRVRSCNETAGRPEGDITVCEEAGSFTVRTPAASYSGLNMAMGGAFQHRNAACAIGAVEILARDSGFTVRDEALRAALGSTTLPGRMQVVSRRPLVILDGAHNDMAANALAGEIDRIPHERLLLVVGMVTGHEPDGVLQALAPRASIVFATQPTWTRARPAETIAEASRRYCKDVRISRPPLRAARAALATASPDDLVLITGSFYVVGDIPPEKLVR